jgi:hypothetical protein
LDIYHTETNHSQYWNFTSDESSSGPSSATLESVMTEDSSKEVVSLRSSGIIFKLLEKRYLERLPPKFAVSWLFDIMILP